MFKLISKSRKFRVAIFGHSEDILMILFNEEKTWISGDDVVFRMKFERNRRKRSHVDILKSYQKIIARFLLKNVWFCDENASIFSTVENVLQTVSNE